MGSPSCPETERRDEQRAGKAAGSWIVASEGRWSRVPLGWPWGPRSCSRQPFSPTSVTLHQTCFPAAPE